MVDDSLDIPVGMRVGTRIRSPIRGGTDVVWF